MSVEAQIIAWGLAATAPLLLNILTRRRADAIGLAAMLLMTWCFGRIMGALFTVPESMTLYPLEDAICGIVAFVAWRSQRAWWKLALAFLFVAQCALHAAFWLAWERGQHQALLFYVTANNAIFALELSCVGWGAVLHVAHHLVARLPRLAGVVHPRGHG